ncbi:MAG: methyltransferase domain-containing protein [Gemmataceae bacterium]|nr:methyltransferase domain-containing protein [Gemmataceae bacterium]
MKSSIDEIRARFDADVERFSNLETGQTAAMGSAVALELIARAAIAATPHARRTLDLGCGAGNFTLRLLQQKPMKAITLVDLSRPMLDRAEQRVRAVHSGEVTSLQADIRDVSLPAGSMDVILAGAVLHHLRTDAEWEITFAMLHRFLAPGGSLWIFDMVTHEHPAVQAMMHARYGDYLASLKGDAYRDHVFAYIEKEDTPRPLTYQTELLRSVGFAKIEVLHFDTCFAAFGGVKAL